MTFWKDFGLDSDLVSDEVLSAMAAKAEIFLRCGGVIGFREFDGLGSAGISAMQFAAEKLRAEQSAMIGYAAQGTDQVLEIFSMVDGGKLKTEVALGKAANQLAERLKTRAPTRA